MKLQLPAPTASQDIPSPELPPRKRKPVSDPTKVKFRTVTGPNRSQAVYRPVFECISPPASPIHGPSTATTTPSSTLTKPVDSQPHTMHKADQAVSFTTSPFDLSKFLCVPHSLTHPPGTSTHNSPALNVSSNPFRPWTATPDLPVVTTPNTSSMLKLTGYELNTLAALSVLSPVVPSQWKTPPRPRPETPINLPTPPTFSTTNPFYQMVVQGSPLLPAVSSPQHDIDNITTNPMATNHPVMNVLEDPDTSSTTAPTGDPLVTTNGNYAPISECDNLSVQKNVKVISDLVEEVLPGRGPFIGESILFQYLIQRPFVVVEKDPSD